MRTVTVEDNKIVVEVDGAKVRYDLRIVQKRIASLLQDLEEWRKYERLLTPLAPDAAKAEPYFDSELPEEYIEGVIYHQKRRAGKA